MKHISFTQIILYVSNQEKSKDFYSQIFRKEPDLHVLGMTKFILSNTCKLGLMPNNGIAKILKDKTPHPESGNGIPRCELDFYVQDIELEFSNAMESGALLISPIADKDWGDKVCYFSDLDGHIIAFAQKIT